MQYYETKEDTCLMFGLLSGTIWP